MSTGKNTLSNADRTKLLVTLRARFERNIGRHKGLTWNSVQLKLEARPEVIRSLNEMEMTGGEPDVVGRDSKTDQYIFCDCSAESPAGRRNVCYDRAGREARQKQGLQAGSALEMSEAMGVDLLTEEQYRELQEIGNFDTKTSSWVQTPASIRKLGGALFGDRRYERVFVYHNGAQSFYSGRGFRASLRV
jgi:hypothetical protein